MPVMDTNVAMSNPIMKALLKRHLSPAKIQLLAHVQFVLGIKHPTLSPMVQSTNFWDTHTSHH